MTAPTYTPISQFVRDHHISMKCEWAASNPFMDNSQNMDNWKCVLRADRKRMTVYFSKGIGHHGEEPTACEVLDCLAMDAGGIENNSAFENWCLEYGYDADSRKAEKIFRTCNLQAASLKQFLGDDAYAHLLWETERQ